tara:strand:+ start:8 stop:214 length:207 start_codon:yes stop_codon:yes gene_type:complete
MSLYGHTRPNEQKASELLADTDWTQLSDSGLKDDCVASFKTYRASLRVIRKTNPSNPTFPTKPKEEWK